MRPEDCLSADKKERGLGRGCGKRLDGVRASTRLAFFFLEKSGTVSR